MHCSQLLVPVLRRSYQHLTGRPPNREENIQLAFNLLILKFSQPYRDLRLPWPFFRKVWHLGVRLRGSEPLVCLPSRLRGESVPNSSGEGYARVHFPCRSRGGYPIEGCRGQVRKQLKIPMIAPGESRGALWLVPVWCQRSPGFERKIERTGGMVSYESH